MLENHNVFLSQLKAKSIKLVNIGAEDLAGGDQKLVLGLTWTLILRYRRQGSHRPSSPSSEAHSHLPTLPYPYPQVRDPQIWRE